MGEGEGGEEKESFSPSALSFFRFHLSPFPQKRLILRLTLRGKGVMNIMLLLRAESIQKIGNKPYQIP